jgi:hypothetical protein
MKSEDQERYLGGFSSPSLRKGIAAGYGIYATNRRFFGIYDRLARPGPFFQGKPLDHVLNKVLAQHGMVAVIRELEQRKDLEIPREYVSRVEINRPGWLKRGRIAIELASGDRVILWMLQDEDFERARQLFRKFCPEALSITK